MIGEFKSILDLVKAFPTEQDCIEHLEKLRWNGNVVSPFDETSKVYKCSGNRYKCKNTGKYFNVKVGTIFEDTKIPLIKWFMALYIFSSHKKGISSHQLAKDIDVTQKTAWFLLHRLRYAFDHPAFKQALENTVEIDETYIGGEEKNKHESKKTQGTQGRSVKTKKPVLGMRQRGGVLIAKVVSDTKQATIEPVIEASIKCNTTVMTDEWQAYNRLNQKFNHERVNHGAKQFVNGMAHTNGVENFWSHLKRGIDGIYHWVSVGHLQSYVDEFSYRFNTRNYTTSQRFNVALENMTGRLTYKELTA
ncbi:transposase-like protein [Dyadobacter sp. BE34]|uniref:Transposase-like protein n=1 Tax=Dyadobacter fermentans TaxID=94254 RepID=A0ABU1QTY2_9BACT|nr:MULTISPECIES: IS1595 family transposase [Dyadobacter]MDR6804615.1 transposase-like protein [Dyadobacter fermentans]MDR7043626.1 transposase-like protein [Dyadobacter sp. BE242]MDR7197938.1 transposase-like protein [Dyadobacter sp. BE34]MDR7214629.1 transposase-like protein [Dyadobacter sp. BE31]MDR7262164.1 transposase-like protein [Dyadobacter sp. BE32]